MNTGVVVSSGRFDRALGYLIKSANRVEKECSLSFHTETTGRSPEGLKKAFKDPRWDFAHVFGPGASEECLTRYRKDLWTPAGDIFARQITELTWVRSPEYGGKKAAYVRALVAPLEWKVKKGTGGKVVVTINVHMPLDNTKSRAAAWRDCCEGILELVRQMRRFYPGCEFIISADWNKNWKEGDERAAMVSNMLAPLRKIDPSFRYCWATVAHLPAGGTHGNDLIDGFFTTLPIIDCDLMADDPSSDHRPMHGVVKVT